MYLFTSIQDCKVEQVRGDLNLSHVKTSLKQPVFFSAALRCFRNIAQES